MSKNQRLKAKKDHILEQIEAIKLQKGIVGKHEGELLDPPEEIKFQQWRLQVIESLMGRSEKAIRKELKSMGKPESTRDRVLFDLLRYAVGEV